MKNWLCTLEFFLTFPGLSDVEEDKGKLDISCVNVEGAKTPLTRDDAAGILTSAGELQSGAETDTSVDTWHYDHLKQ